MPIPTATEHKLAEIADLHALILVKLGVVMRGGERAPVREALQAYVDRVIECVNGT